MHAPSTHRFEFCVFVVAVVAIVRFMVQRGDETFTTEYESHSLTTKKIFI